MAVAILAHHHANPHVPAHQRAQAHAKTADELNLQAATEATAAEHALQNALFRLHDVPGKWEAHRHDLTTFTDELEAIYLRALATGTADPEFTTAVERNIPARHQPRPHRSTRARTTTTPIGPSTPPTSPKEKQTMLRRLWRIARGHPTTGCPFCGQLLTLCPDCRGEWHQHRCRRCAIGLLCPTHDRHWPA